MDEWYKDWFNTEEYLNVYRHRNDEDAKRLVNLVLSKVKLPENSGVLDLACGAGRHSILFAENRFKVTAVDLSENLLEVAKKSAEKAGVHVNFVRCDIRYFSISAKFSLVVNLFTSFGYFEEDEENFRVFKVAYEHLQAGGYFVLDFFNKCYIEKNLVPESVNVYNGEKIIQRRSVEGSRIKKKIFIMKNGNEKHYHESVRMYCKDELISAIERHGFEIKSLFGDFDGNYFDHEKSKRIIIIARK